jgi:type III secretory pathway component EscT
MEILQCSLDELVAAMEKTLLKRGINVAIAVLHPFLTSTLSSDKMHNCIAGAIALPSAPDNLD